MLRLAEEVALDFREVVNLRARRVQIGKFDSEGWVGREHCSHVHEHLFAFAVRKYCSELNTV